MSIESAITEERWYTRAGSKKKKKNRADQRRTTRQSTRHTHSSSLSFFNQRPFHPPLTLSLSLLRVCVSLERLPLALLSPSGCTFQSLDPADRNEISFSSFSSFPPQQAKLVEIARLCISHHFLVNGYLVSRNVEINFSVIGNDHVHHRRCRTLIHRKSFAPSKAQCQ